MKSILDLIVAVIDKKSGIWATLISIYMLCSFVISMAD